jgi:hypothetical protein
MNRFLNFSVTPVATMVGKRHVVERVAAGYESGQNALHQTWPDDAWRVTVIPRNLHQRPTLALDCVANCVFAVVAAAPEQDGHTFSPRPFRRGLYDSILLLWPIRYSRFGPVPPAETRPRHVYMAAACGN